MVDFHNIFSGNTTYYFRLSNTRPINARAAREKFIQYELRVESVLYCLSLSFLSIDKREIEAFALVNKINKPYSLFRIRYNLISSVIK